MIREAGVLTVKAELNRCGHFIDILPARSTGTDSLKFKLVFWNSERGQTALNHH